MRARRALKDHHERVKILVADSATIGELSERIQQRRGESFNFDDFPDFVAGQAGLALDLA